MTTSVMDVIRNQLSSKITVYLDDDTLDALKKDCNDFEVKNISEFTNLLIKNYVADFFESIYSSIPAISKVLCDYFGNNAENTQISKQIAFIKGISGKAKGSLSKTLNFRLNRKIINIAVEALYNGPSTLDISAFFRSLFLSYLSLPVYKREQIIYKDELNIINTAINNKEKLAYYRKDTGKTHTLNPYSIETSSHEMFNYLVGQFDYSKKHKTSIRISKIKDIVPVHERAEFTDDFEICLEAMKRNGIQFAMDEVIVKTIELNEDQYKAYWKKYIDRPAIVSETIVDGIHICTFDCSDFQLETYFTPFNNNIKIPKKD